MRATTIEVASNHYVGRSVYALLFNAVFGFIQSTFTAVERSQPYAVDIGFLSGSVPSQVSFNVQLSRETARNMK